MNSEKFAVVFDTNSYRNLIRGNSIEEIKANIAQLKEKEASKNIITLATPVVSLELLANLSGPGKSLHYDDCLKALVAMANHCYVETENISILSRSLMSTSHVIFSMSPRQPLN